MGGQVIDKRAFSVRPVKNSSILRTIGQDLESRDIKAFVITREVDRLVVKGSYQNPPSPTPINLDYSLGEIDELDLQRGEKREEIPPSGDFFTLAQTLRAIGGYIDKKGGRLLRISNNDSARGEFFFRIEYESAEGSRIIDDRDGSAIYDICVSMYKLRGKARRAGAVFGRGRR
ncbi:MAG: hypothetical protein ACREQ7_07125 [Candidatus Binatia bacterium]